MKRHSLTLVLGGAASGKSEFAESLARRLGRRILYLATATAGRATRTPEWRRKIRRHLARRPAEWQTVVLNGMPLSVGGPRARPHGILLDSLTLWIARQYDTKPEARLEEELTGLIHTLRRHAPVIVVSDEVGLGLVPMGNPARRFVESLGRANARVGRAAGAVYLVLSGQPVRIK